MLLMRLVSDVICYLTAWRTQLTRGPSLATLPARCWLLGPYQGLSVRAGRQHWPFGAVRVAWVLARLVV